MKLMKVKQESERAGLKLKIQKTKIMASSPITSWHKMRKQWEQWQTLFFLAPKWLQIVTAAMKLKDAPWKKSYDQPRQHIKKQRRYFASKGPSSQGYVFTNSHVWMLELEYKESWALKIDPLEVWCLRSLLRVPWTARRFNQSILKEISVEYSLEGRMLKLNLQ